MLILDESVSIPRLLVTIGYFFEMESCGKCTPCREGTREVRKLLERFALGGNSAGDVHSLMELARQMNLTSLCGLGQSVAWPVQSALRHFESEFVRSSQ
jgi:NADH-quinone oxidoreductase subunit F